MNAIDDFFDMLKVHETPYTKIRLGRHSDGGYVVLKELAEKAKRLYSFGVANDISFEEDFVRLNPSCKVNLFDPTIDRLPAEHENFTFSKQGLFDDLSLLAGDTEDAVLKLDIEWGEWDALDCANRWMLAGYDMIIGEFHIIPACYYPGQHTEYFTRFHADVYGRMNRWIFDKYTDILDRLLKRYVIYHIHPNNSLMPVTVEGYTFPPLLEIGFVNRMNVPLMMEEIKHELPIAGLDFPNKPYKPEITGFYPFSKKEVSCSVTC